MSDDNKVLEDQPDPTWEPVGPFAAKVLWQMQLTHDPRALVTMLADNYRTMGTAMENNPERAKAFFAFTPEQMTLLVMALEAKTGKVKQ